MDFEHPQKPRGLLLIIREKKRLKPNRETAQSIDVAAFEPASAATGGVSDFKCGPPDYRPGLSSSRPARNRQLCTLACEGKAAMAPASSTSCFARGSSSLRNRSR